MNHDIRLATPDGIELDFPLAGIASRAIACLLDLLLLFGLWAAFLIATLGFAGLAQLDQAEGVAMALWVVVLFISYWGYGIFWELLMQGQTPGKRVMGLRVLRDNGLPIGLKQSLLRNLLRAVDLQPGASYVLGMITMIADGKDRRLGDLVAGTIVIRDSVSDVHLTRTGALWAARAEEGKTQEALRLPGGALTAKQLSVVEQFLERRAMLDEARKAEVALRIAGSLKPLLGSELSKLLEKSPEELLEKVQALAAASADEIEVTARACGSRGLF